MMVIIIHYAWNIGIYRDKSESNQLDDTLQGG